MYLNNQPTKVQVNPESIKKDYEILKENLPIQMGIDHLDMDPNFLKQNKILHKLNLLNVGTINDVKLEDNKIKISDAEITNPAIQELYDKGELTDFSPVSTMYASKCPTGQADKVEQYSVINRVDFVPKGACKTCNVNYEGNASLSTEIERYDAKAIIGDENMATDPNAGNPAPDNGSIGNDPDDEAQDATLADIVAAINAQGTKLDSIQAGITALEGNAGIKEVAAIPDPNADPNATPAAASDSKPDPEIASLRKDVDEFKAQAAKSEANAIVEPFLKEGKILPADVEKHIGMAMKSPEDYKSIMESAAVVVDMKKHVKGDDGNASDSTDIVDKDGNTLEDSIKIVNKSLGRED